MKSAIFLFLLCITLSVQGQQLVRERIYRINGLQKIISASAITRQGNIILTGNSFANPGYRALHLLVKSNTDTLWMREGALLVTGDQSIRQTADNGFIVSGIVRPAIPANFSDFILRRLNAAGSPLWIKTFAAGATLSILVASDSGYFLGGLGGIAGKNSRTSLTRTDSLGNIKWQKDYTWTNGDYLMDMKYTPTGNIVMAGTTYDANFHGYLKLFLVNQNGDSIRGAAVPTYSPFDNEAMLFTDNSVTPLTDGGFLVTGRIDTTFGGNTKHRGMVVKVDANLNPLWRYIKRTNPVEEHIFTKSQELTDGSVLVLSSGFLPANNQFKIYRFSSAGALLNTYTFTTAIASTVIVNTFDALADSTYLIGGEAMVSQFPYQNGLYVAKVRLNNIPQAIHLPVITGIKPDFALVKASLGQSYPNPTGGEAVIPYTLPQNAKVAVITINEIVTGRQVKRYELKQGEKNVSINLNNLRNGIYAYTLYVDEKPIATNKLSVVK